MPEMVRIGDEEVDMEGCVRVQQYYDGEWVVDVLFRRPSGDLILDSIRTFRGLRACGDVQRYWRSRQ